MTINTSRYDFYKIQRNNKISVILVIKFIVLNKLLSAPIVLIQS